MNIRFETALWPFLAALTLAGLPACSDDPLASGDASMAVGEPTSIRGTTVFPQRIFISTGDGEPEILPDQPNYWDLQPDFSIGQGGLSNMATGQIRNALALRVKVFGLKCRFPVNEGDEFCPFPADQTYEELEWLTPLFGSGDGVTTATACDGKACLAPTLDSRLSQTVDLRTAVPPIRLEFEAMEKLGPAPGPLLPSREEHFPEEPSYFQVVIRDAQGGVLQSVVQVTGDDVCCPPPSEFTLRDDLAGQQVVLSFEQRGPANGSQTIIDEVAVCASGANPCDAANLVENGGFDAGLDGWTANAPTAVRNVRAGTRVLSFGLEGDPNAVAIHVSRSFYAPPRSTWARMVDVYTNPSGETIELSADYRVGLAAGRKVIAYTPTDTEGWAVATWDGGLRAIRDVGWAMGFTTDVDFRSDTVIGGDPAPPAAPRIGKGLDAIYATYDFAVAAGQSVGLAHYLVLLAEATGVEDVENIGVRAENLDTELRRIVSGYPEDASINTYTEGLTQEQLDAIANF